MKRFSTTKIEKLLSHPSSVDPNQFYLIESATDRVKFYISDTQSELHLLNELTDTDNLLLDALRAVRYLSEWECDLEAALTELGSDPVELRLTERCTVSTNITVPYTVRLSFEAEGGFSVNTGKTLRILNISPTAPTRIFWGEGTVIIENAPEVWVDWWENWRVGTDHRSGLNQAIAGVSILGGTIRIGLGKWYFGDHIINSNTAIVGSSWGIDAGAYGGADEGTTWNMVEGSSYFLRMRPIMEGDNGIYGHPHNNLITHNNFICNTNTSCIVANWGDFTSNCGIYMHRIYENSFKSLASVDTTDLVAGNKLVVFDGEPPEGVSAPQMEMGSMYIERNWFDVPPGGEGLYINTPNCEWIIRQNRFRCTHVGKYDGVWDRGIHFKRFAWTICDTNNFSGPIGGTYGADDIYERTLDDVTLSRYTGYDEVRPGIIVDDIHAQMVINGSSNISDNDLGKKLYFTGFEAQISKVLDNKTAVLSYHPTSYTSYVNVSADLHYWDEQPNIGGIAYYIEGNSSAQMYILNSVDEGLNYSLWVKDTGYPGRIKSQNSIYQGRGILEDGDTVLDFDTCHIYSLFLDNRSTVTDPIYRWKDCHVYHQTVFPGVTVDDASEYYHRTATDRELENSNLRECWLGESGPLTAVSIWKNPFYFGEVVRIRDCDYNYEITDSSFSVGAKTDRKRLLELGRQDPTNQRDLIYSYWFLYDFATGALELDGNQEEIKHLRVKTGLYSDVFLAISDSTAIEMEGDSSINFQGSGSFTKVTGGVQFSANLTAANLSGTNTGDQLVFKNIAVAGQSDVVADTATDTLTLVAGTGMTLTTNATTDSITFAASSGITESELYTLITGLGHNATPNGIAEIGYADTDGHMKYMTFNDLNGYTYAQIGVLISGTTSKTPADADEFMFGDSAASYINKKVAWSGIKSTLKTYFDGFYSGDQLVFKTIAVSGQSSVVADTATDTLTLVAGTGMTITTDASTDTITFVSAGAVDDTAFDVSWDAVTTVAPSKNAVYDKFATLGTMSTQNAPAVTISGGTISDVILSVPSNSLQIQSSVISRTLQFAQTGSLTTSRTLTFDVSNGNRTLTLPGNATISGTNTGDQLTFSTVSVSGQSDVVADTATDVLTFAAGSNVAITTDATTDTVTISAFTTTKSANTVFAGPTTGAAAVPAFRALVATDLPAGTGTVTSVAMTVPAIMSVAGSPVTTSGTLAVSLVTQTANTVWAGPTSGGVATPAFRALVAADIPTIANTQVSGLGTMSTQNANAVAVTGGTVDNVTITNSLGVFASSSLQLLNGSRSLIFATGGASFGVSNRTLTIDVNNGNRTLAIPGNATISGTNTGDVTLSGETYLSLSGQVITANAVDLSGTNVTGHLAGSKFLGKVEAAVRRMRGI